MKIISVSFFTLSIIIGISAAARMTPKGDVPENLPIFIVSIVLGIGSLLFWHKSVKLEAKEAVKGNREGHTPIESLKSLHGKMKIIKESGEFSDNFCDQIDELTDGDIFDFHENSEILKELIGQEKAAEIILSFAQSERLINRSWSAFSDGHSEEAENSFDQAFINLGSLITTHS